MTVKICLSFSTNSFGLHFRDKRKKQQKYKHIRKPTNGQEKYGGKKHAHVHIWHKISETNIISSNFSLKSV